MYAHLQGWFSWDTVVPGGGGLALFLEKVSPSSPSPARTLLWSPSVVDKHPRVSPRVDTS